MFPELPVPLGAQLPPQVVEDFLESEDVAYGFAGIAVSGEIRAVESASSVFLEDGSGRWHVGARIGLWGPVRRRTRSPTLPQGGACISQQRCQPHNGFTSSGFKASEMKAMKGQLHE